MTDDTPALNGRSRLPDLGPSGEGWVVGQLALIGLLILAGLPGLGRMWPASPIGWLGFLFGAAAIAVGGVAVGRALFDLGESLTPVPRPRPDGRLVEWGIYASVRHPIYAGLVLAAVGWSALTQSLAAFLLALLFAAFMDAKARREEAWLMERYATYADYRRRSKRFVPGVY